MEFPVLSAREEPQYALAHVVKINGASGQALALHLPEVHNPFFDHALPRPCGAMALADESEYFSAKVAVAEQRLVRTEDCRLVFAGTDLHCVVDGTELIARSN
jgi:hypothetical protein